MSLVVKCPHCTKEWFTTEEEAEKLSECPFCEKELTKECAHPVKESRLDDRLEANGCQIYLRGTSLFEWLKKPDIHVCDMFDLSESGAGIFLSEKSVITPEALKDKSQKIIIEGIFLDIPSEKKRVITGPIHIPAEVRWITGASGDGRAGLKFLEGESEGRDAIFEIVKVLREQAKSMESSDSKNEVDSDENSLSDNTSDTPPSQ